MSALHYCIFEPSGRIVSIGDAPAEQIPYQAMPGLIARACPPEVGLDTHYADLDGSFVALPPRPSTRSVFDYALKTWVTAADEALSDIESALWDDLRKERDRRLSATDWTQVADAPVDKAAWAEYRQALRNLPDTTVDPAFPDWPVQPIKG